MGLLGAVAWAVAWGAAAGAAEPPAWATRDLRAGIIGTDTSHVPAFTNAFNKVHPEWRIRVVAAYPAGSPDVPASRDRVEKFAQDIKEKHGVELVDSVEALLPKVDVVLVESVDGRPHLEQIRPVLKAGKRVYIDKPFTASIADAREILRLSKETGTPFFSCSSFRYHPDAQKLRNEPVVGKITKVQGCSPLNLIPFHPDLFFYGIHGVEAMYTVLGRGCVAVTRKAEGDLDITTGRWADGRIGIYRGVKKGPAQPVLKAWGTEGEFEATQKGGYDGMLAVMAEFFHTGKTPIDPLETLEIIEFMTAAQLSHERGGAEVLLDEVRR